MAYPNYDKTFIVDSDCSGVGIGVVLSQDDEGKERPIAYYSRSLNSAERKYGITKQEMCAMVSSIRHFRHYLLGKEFVARVDHHSLIWLQSLKAPTGILARWLETLSEFQFTVIHRPGRLHGNTDGLSRMISDKGIVCSSIVAAETNWLIKSQEKDLILQILKDGTKGKKENWAKFRAKERTYLRNCNQLDIKDEILCETSREIPRPIIPEKEINNIIQAEHQIDDAGVHRLAERIIRKYYWPNAKADIKRFVSNCIACQKGKERDLTAHQEIWKWE